MLVLLAGVCSVALNAQAPIPREPTLPKTTVGSELYRFYCANCHGQDAKGRAPTPAMRTASADLTTLATKNGGVFPRETVRALLAQGPEKSAAHGPCGAQSSGHSTRTTRWWPCGSITW